MTEGALQFSRSVALKLWLPCRLTEVRPAAMKVSDFLREQALPSEEIQACELALVEACNNAVQYASGTGKSENIAVEVLCDPSAVQLQIRDHTAGFEWPAALDLPDPEQERGRGLFLIRSLMDNARYFRGDGVNCLVLQKQRAGGPAAKAAASPASIEAASYQLRESEQIISDMAEELSFCYESLSAIFRCSAELGRTHDLKEFSQRLLSDLAQITSADWFVMRLLSRDGAKLTLFTASDPEFNFQPLPVKGGQAEELVSVELQAAVGREDVWFDAGTLSPGDPLQTAQNSSTGLVHPFVIGEQLIGVVAIGKAAGRPQFTAVHANVVHTFADFLGIQIANARFQEEQVHARVVSRELEIAKNIQRSLLPKSLPQIPGFGLAGYCESAQQVGGDFYDVVRFDNDSLLLIVADVMGKGIPAAMFAAILRSLLRAVPEWTDQPAHLLGRVNRLLFKELSGVDMFITAQLVFVNTAQSRMVAASAGHCPMLLAHDKEPSVKVLSPEGLPLGILPETTFGAQVEELSKDSRLLLYTDGLTEARNADGQFFGHDRLVDWFQKSLHHRYSAEDLKRNLAAELNAFQGPAAIQDDQTFLIMA
jgi:serine phosphatase RsbU (regulator of sigma subunit)/anti-sigma regulatory factor (Ser/Thr protein kinase)